MPAKCSDDGGLVAALKLVPWGDVIEATPQILQAAKKLLGAARKGSAEATASAGGLPDPAESSLPAPAQLQHLRERVAQLEQEQMDSAALIQSLDRKSTRLNSSHLKLSRMPSSA